METNLAGTWQMIRAELAGEVAPELVASNTIVTLTARTYEVRFDGEVRDQGTFDVDAAAEARTILLHGDRGTNAGRTIPAIFQLKGDRLRICYGLDGVRPAEFVTRAGEARYLATFRRVGLIPQSRPGTAS